MAEKLSRAVLAHAVRLHEAAAAACRASGVQTEQYRFASDGSWWDLGDLSTRLVKPETTLSGYIPKIGGIALSAITDRPNLHRRVFDARRTSLTDRFGDSFRLTVSHGVMGSKSHPGTIPSDKPFELELQSFGGKFLVPYSDNWTRIKDEFMDLSMDTFCMPTERTTESTAADQKVLRGALGDLSRQFVRKPYDGSVFFFKIDENFFARITSYTPELYLEGSGSVYCNTPAFNQNSIFMDIVHHGGDHQFPDQIVASLESYQSTLGHPDLIWATASRLLAPDNVNDPNRNRIMTVEETVSMVSVFDQLCRNSESSLSLKSGSYSNLYSEGILGLPTPRQAGVANLAQSQVGLTDLNLLIGIGN